MLPAPWVGRRNVGSADHPLELRVAHPCTAAPLSLFPTVLPWPPLGPCTSAGYATVDKAEALTAPTPVLGKLGGGQTPLMGNAKVGAGWGSGCWLGKAGAGWGVGCLPRQLGSFPPSGGSSVTKQRQQQRRQTTTCVSCADAPQFTCTLPANAQLNVS